jgi:predicted HNH restriction endonuclease
VSFFLYYKLQTASFLVLSICAMFCTTFRCSSVVEQSPVSKGSLWYTLYMSTRVEKRTYADRAVYMREAVKKRRRKLREMARASRGSKCQICGYNKSQRALSFHHIDPSKKEFALSTKGLTRSWKRIEAEIKKCVLICANCHMEVHDGITQLPKVI